MKIDKEKIKKLNYALTLHKNIVSMNISKMELIPKRSLKSKQRLENKKLKGGT